MSDHITQLHESDIRLASTVRAFIASAAVQSLISAHVQELILEIIRTEPEILNDSIAAAVAKQVDLVINDRIKQQVDLVMAAHIDEALRSENLTDIVREIIEDRPRWLRSSLADMVHDNLDTDEIADDAKNKVIENLDLDDLNIEDKVNEIIDNRDTALSDDDIDKIATRVCRVIVIQPYNKSFM